jgi:hypothetical protein
MWWMLACSVGSGALDTPFELEGDGVIAHVRSAGGCGGNEVRVGLWGPRFGTDGEVGADVVRDPSGVTWLHFRVGTGLGEAIAALRLEGQSAVIPLGTRPGESQLHLKRVELSRERLAIAASESALALEEERQLWADGAFLLQSDGKTVGEMRFRGDRSPIVSVHDTWWLTPRPVEGMLSAEGAELLVVFDVEPSLQGEGGLLRVNVPLRTAVAPLGEVPIVEERRFTLVPGRLEESARGALIQAAIESADALEKDFVEHTARRIGAHALDEEGRCENWAEFDEAWTVLLRGYEVEVTQTPEGCSVGVEPVRIQHGRRFRGVITP